LLRGRYTRDRVAGTNYPVFTAEVVEGADTPNHGHFDIFIVNWQHFQFAHRKVTVITKVIVLQFGSHFDSQLKSIAVIAGCVLGDAKEVRLGAS
jgi:hypothetical protein